MKPFLRWVGGKYLFVDSIIKFFPKKNTINKYYEPFVGAGALFFAYRPINAVISDLNPQLINTYNAVRDNYMLLYSYLLDFSKAHSKKFYYKTRTEYNSSKLFSIKQAARFIYLNKACFNGIFRVNEDGHFNVPFGDKKKISLLTKSEFLEISKLLNKTKILNSDFAATVENVKKEDFVYLDPPYPPINGSSFFTHYTKERFSIEDQEKVAHTAQLLNKIGCKVLITNADTREIRQLYKEWNIIEIKRTRWVTSSRIKHKAEELIITNYSVNKEV